jgi:hypothetical protein
MQCTYVTGGLFSGAMSMRMAGACLDSELVDEHMQRMRQLTEEEAKPKTYACAGSEGASSSAVGRCAYPPDICMFALFSSSLAVL